MLLYKDFTDMIRELKQQDKVLREYYKLTLKAAQQHRDL